MECNAFGTVMYIYIFGHMKLRLGKMMLIGNEGLEKGAGGALWLE